MDVGAITKDTEASISTATVNADGNIVVVALSSENLTSLTASVGVGGDVGVAASAGVYVLKVTTRAFIGDDPDNPTPGTTDVYASGSILVAAMEATTLNLLSGNFSGSGTVSAGAAATVPVINKTTESFIGADAQVTALGLGSGISAENGQFQITYGSYASSPGVIQPTPMSANVSSSTNSSNNDLNSPRFTGQRIATPLTQTLHGLAVTADNQDAIQGVGVDGGASGAVAVNLSGSVGVITNNTSADIGSAPRSIRPIRAQRRPRQSWSRPATIRRSSVSQARSRSQGRSA